MPTMRTFVVLITGLLATSLQAQTLDEIVARHVEASGGLERLRAVQSIRMTGRVKAGPTQEALVLREIRQPGHIRTEFTVQGMTAVYACDGERGWLVSPFDGKVVPELMPEEQTRQALEHSDIAGPLVDWQAKGHQLELVGRAKVGEQDVHELKLTLKTGATRRAYIDAESYLLVEMESERLIGDRMRVVENTYSDYREVEGLLFPHTIQSAGKGGVDPLSVVVEKVELNPDLPDDRFALPPSLRPASPD